MSSSRSFVGPPIDDFDVLGRLPSDYAASLREVNGFIYFDGGLHVRGACTDPIWHSLRAVWEGETSLEKLYPAVHKSDIPFAQDCFGDQFLIRESRVIRLYSETGQIEPLSMTFQEFFQKADDDPTGFFSLEPLARFNNRGGTLVPGQLLSVYPPFCVKEGSERSLRAIPMAERIGSLADFARQIREIPDGQTIRVAVK